MRVASGRVASVTLWPVKSMAGGTDVPEVRAERRGLVGDRAHAVVDRRPLRDGHVLSARNAPGLLRWTARADGDEPLVTAPDGRQWRWSDDGLRDVVAEDLGFPVDLAGPGTYSDLADSVLLTTRATHDDVESRFGRPLEAHRWRTNLTVELDAEAHAERGWEGRTVVVGEVVLRLLHPCKRCTIPTWSPDGRARSMDLLQWFHREADGVFGINARVEVPGVLRAGDPVEVR